MSTLIERLVSRFEGAVLELFPDFDLASCPMEITTSTRAEFGHYQCNAAMKMARPLKLSPRDIAARLIGCVQNEDEMIANMEIAGPGFINITLNAAFLSRWVDSQLRDPRLGVPLPKKSEKIIVEFSSPNTAKELHVGHLRSTIIGDCLARLFEFLGYEVLRLNHIGDWGTQFGMLIAHMREKHPHVLEGIEMTDLSHLVTWYKESKKRFDDDADFKKRAQEAVVELQQGVPEVRRSWEILCEISRKAYWEIYELMGVQLVERGESFYNPMLAQIVEDCEKKELVVNSGGAKCIFMEGFINREGDPLPMILQKSDGGYNYDTTDMAAMKHRVSEEKADRIIVVTDLGQKLHFQMLEKAAKMAGYLPDHVRFDHVTFGMVLDMEGRKFRTRSGETEKLVDLLYTAIERSQEIINERNPEMKAQEKKNLARVIGVGAVKYADLACNRNSDYTFSYEKMLRFDGNTAVYLLYSYVRINGIKRKVGRDADQVLREKEIILEHPSEVELGLHLAQFPEVLAALSEDLSPNRLADYLYQLANYFNAFFRDCRVEGSDREGERLLLCEIAAKILARGLHLLGLELVERM